MNTPLPPTCPKCGATLPVDAPEGLCPRCLAAMNLATETVFTGADAVAAQTPLSPAELAPHFPQLEIIECLGRGGMGVVYKARQKSLNRLIALKLLAPERVADTAFAQRFTREAQALAALNHPHIVTIHDFGQAGGFYYLLMEFVDGVNLRQAMKAGRFTPEQALAVVPPVCEALQYAHEHGIVHRDIKPENLLLDTEGRVKIADFGIAKLLHAGDADAGLADSQPAGTPPYMAPEQKEHRRTDHRADIYSLGVVLYEMLTGELPADKLQPLSRKVLVDVRLDEIVLRALASKPELRYQTAGELRTQVEALVSTPVSGQHSSALSILKAGTSTITTPEKLATFSGQFFHYLTRGQLILDDRQLTYSREGMNTVIPLAAIRELSIGQYPRLVNPVGLDYLSVTYEEQGRRKELLLSPMKGWFGLPSTFNDHVVEWRSAIGNAILAATGRAPATGRVEKVRTPLRPLAGMLALFAVPALLAVGMLVWMAFSSRQARQATQAARRTMADARAEVEVRQGLKRTTTPALQTTLTAWEQGDHVAAVRHFLAADWSAGPIFSSESMLSLTESEFLAQVSGLSQAGESGTKNARMLRELRTIKELVVAVFQAGRDAAATNNAVLARQHFSSLWQFGAALDNFNALNILRLEGRAIKKKADRELQQQQNGDGKGKE